MKKTIIIILAILIVSGMVGVSIYYYLQNIRKQIAIPKTTQQETIDEIVNWKTYTNNDLGFSIKYPSEFSEMDLKLIKSGEAKVVSGSLWQGGIPYKDAPNYRILITSQSSDYEGMPRGTSFADWQIFEKKDDNYYLKFTALSDGELVKPYKIISDDIIILDENSVSKEDFMMKPPSGRGAVINLKGRNFIGISITLNDIYIDKIVFDKIIESIELFEPQTQPEPIINNPPPEENKELNTEIKTSTRISIDSVWDLYTNYNFNFSIKVPKQVIGLSDKNKMIPVNIDEKNNGVSFGFGDNNVGWFILIKDDIKSDADIQEFIQSKYFPGCLMTNKSENSNHPGTYYVEITNTGFGGDCFINWVTGIWYSPSLQRLAQYNLGQSPKFFISDTNAVDPEMIGSFQFTK